MRLGYFSILYPPSFSMFPPTAAGFNSTDFQIYEWFPPKTQKKEEKRPLSFSYVILIIDVYRSIIIPRQKKKKKKRKRKKKEKVMTWFMSDYSWVGWLKERKNLLVGHGSSLSVYHCLHTEFLIKLRYRVIRKDVGRGAWRCWKDRQHSNTPGNVVPFLNISIFGKEGGQNGVIRHG